MCRQNPQEPSIERGSHQGRQEPAEAADPERG